MAIFEISGLEEIIRSARGLPRDKQRATKSALGSVGFFLIGELKKQIDTMGSHAGSKWKAQHPLTRLPKKRTGKQQRIRLRANRPLRGLRKFTRYRASDTAVQVLFARSRRGRIGSFDRLMNEFVARSEFGEIQSLTERSRRYRAARGFAVRRSTTSIKIPKRGIVEPVFEKNRRAIVSLFEEKFLSSLQRRRR